MTVFAETVLFKKDLRLWRTYRLFIHRSRDMSVLRYPSRLEIFLRREEDVRGRKLVEICLNKNVFETLQRRRSSRRRRHVVSETFTNETRFVNSENGVHGKDTEGDLSVIDGATMDETSFMEYRCDDRTVSIVVIGASGDLAKKKIFPALFALFYQGMLPKVRFRTDIKSIVFRTFKFLDLQEAA